MLKTTPARIPPLIYDTKSWGSKETAPLHSRHVQRVEVDEMTDQLPLSGFLSHVCRCRQRNKDENEKIQWSKTKTRPAEKNERNVTCFSDCWFATQGHGRTVRVGIEEELRWSIQRQYWEPQRVLVWKARRCWCTHRRCGWTLISVCTPFGRISRAGANCCTKTSFTLHHPECCSTLVGSQLWE